MIDKIHKAKNYYLFLLKRRMEYYINAMGNENLHQTGGFSSLITFCLFQALTPERKI